MLSQEAKNRVLAALKIEIMTGNLRPVKDTADRPVEEKNPPKP